MHRFLKPPCESRSPAVRHIHRKRCLESSPSPRQPGAMGFQTTSDPDHRELERLNRVYSVRIPPASLAQARNAVRAAPIIVQGFGVWLWYFQGDGDALVVGCQLKTPPCDHAGALLGSLWYGCHLVRSPVQIQRLQHPVRWRRLSCASHYGEVYPPSIEWTLPVMPAARLLTGYATRSATSCLWQDVSWGVRPPSSLEPHCGHPLSVGLLRSPVPRHTHRYLALPAPVRLNESTP